MTSSGAIPLVVLGVWAGFTVAQPASRGPIVTKVEQGVGDVDPASVGLRNLQTDLRTPTNFDTVYRFNRSQPFAQPGAAPTTLFLRRDAGVTAIFSRSTYSSTGNGLVADIPPGTTFYIGDLPTDVTGAPAHRAPRAFNYFDTSFAGAPSPVPDEPRQPPQFEELTIFNSNSYRQRLVADLMSQVSRR